MRHTVSLPRFPPAALGAPSWSLHCGVLVLKPRVGGHGHVKSREPKGANVSREPQNAMPGMVQLHPSDNKSLEDLLKGNVDDWMTQWMIRGTDVDDAVPEFGIEAQIRFLHCARGDQNQQGPSSPCQDFRIALRKSVHQKQL